MPGSQSIRHARTMAETGKERKEGEIWGIEKGGKERKKNEEERKNSAQNSA